ncbi:MAG TPA: class I SAM-dependent methyltransferase [Candidatus Nanoarchaeia archaeon]|nr:class I SAM-dependent methyltransferase [Candidatus Nanoarchaeia archaeon]
MKSKNTQIKQSKKSIAHETQAKKIIPETLPNGKLRLNLGSGKDYRKGFINIDNSPYIKKDLELNLDKYPFPFDDNSVDYILAMAVIEHLEDMKAFMEEVHRILKPGGKLRFRVPLAFTHIDSKDPTHKQHITPDTFNQFFQDGSKSIITKVRFTGNIWITPPLFHHLKFPKKLYLLNSVINNIFTGVEGILVKVEEESPR